MSTPRSLADDTPELTCATHADALAGWRCHGECKKLLCPKCTAALLGAFTCCACGGPAHRTSVARKSRSFASWLVTALANPFSKRGLPLFLLFVLLAGAVPFVTQLVEASPGQLTSVARGAQVGVFALFFLLSVDGGSRGNAAEDGVPLRLARYVVALLWIWVPAGAFVYLLGLGRAPQQDWALLMFAGLALVYVPIALQVAAMDVSFGDVLDPFKMFELAWRLGRVYAGTLVVTAVLAAAAAAIAGPAAAGALKSVNAPFARDALGALPTVAVIGMLGFFIGQITYVHGDTLGWGSPAGYREPVHPTMVAEGRRKVDRSQPLPTDTDGGASAAAGPIKLSPSEKAHVAKLNDAIRTDNLARALRIYEERAWPAGALDDRNLIALSRAATRAKKPELARELLEDAYASGGRAAGQALLALAQLFAAEGNAERAAETYRTVVAKYPNTDVAKVAAKHVEGAA